jgi:phage-related protein (TIGR01555 family)
MVDASRCLIFKGKPVPYHASKYLSVEQRYWGVSELQPLYDSLRDFGGVSDSVSNIMYELIIGKFKMAGLAEMLTGGQEDAVMNRMEIMAIMKSVLHGIMLDENEDYTRDTATLSGIADILDRYMTRVCAESGIPFTRLFGKQAGGLNNKGEAEEDVYYDSVRSKQKTELKPALRPLLELVQSVNKVPDKFIINFNPLFQLSEKEEADTKKTEADAEAQKATMYNTYVQMGTLQEEDVYKLEWEEKLGPREFPEEPELTPEELMAQMSSQNPNEQSIPGGNKPTKGQPAQFPPTKQQVKQVVNPGGGK